ncbi:DEAD/DEAH box helicase, partial [Enterococcus sp. AZ192]|uniref:DEAD/DEAH box helicase n=1 Tax=unclassified Enterococcus TaxID=2608891 RepID=UPI003D2BE18B
DLGTALDPYLESIADEMLEYCKDRKTVVFLPLVKTSQKFTEILNRKGFKAAEVNGDSKDRAEVLEDFENDKYNVLCNSMLLTEGWDCPSVDCVIVLRP